ncbi:MAG: carbohydrate kinase family protein [Verrucomicrobiales bacterium]
MSNRPPKKYDVVGLGMSMIDLFQVVEEFPAGEGVTEVLASTLLGGGPVPTAMVTAATLGARTAMIDRIGADWRGEQVAVEYRKAGVDLSGFTLEKNRSTTFGSVLVRKRDGARHVVFSPGSFTPLDSDELPKGLLRETNILHLNGRHWPACIDAAKIVHENGGQVSFDGGANRYDEKFLELLPLVDVLIVARDFAEKLTESEATGDQLGAMIALGAKIAGVTDGKNGAWFATENGDDVFHQAAYPVESVVDTTGCGDVFHGAFLFGLSQQWSPQECAQLASAAAAMNATALGGRGKIATLSEISEFLQGARIV